MKRHWIVFTALIAVLFGLCTTVAFAAEIGAELTVEEEPTLNAEITVGTDEEEVLVEEPEPLPAVDVETLPVDEHEPLVVTPEVDLTELGDAGETPVQATSNIAINATNFPDDNFRSYVTENFDKDNTFFLSSKEIAAVKEISVYNKGIADMKGVEYFTNLESLSCGGNTFTSLDLSANTALKELYCYNNSKLRSLDVRNHSALQYLDCENSTALTRLVCLNCTLTYLNVKGCTALTYLDCDNNQLTSLNVGDLTKLESLYCNKNSLTTLDVSGKTALKNLYCANNKLTSLNTDKCSALMTLNANSNQTLTRLTCVSCALTELYIRECGALIQLDCRNNALTDIDVRDSSALQYLLCTTNQMKSLDVSNNSQLISLECGNNQLTSLDVSKNAKLDALDCYGNQLTSLDVSKNPVLRYLRCCLNSITSLDVTACSLLAEAYLEGSKTEDSFVGSKIWHYAGSSGILYIDKTTVVKAAPPITSVTLTITEPKIGAKPDYNAVLGSGANYTVQDLTLGSYKNGVCWKETGADDGLTPDSAVFAAGQKYTLMAFLVPKDGYEFAPSGSITATINGKSATIGHWSEDGIRIEYDFPALPEPILITSVSVSITAPKIGAKPDCNAILPSGANYILVTSSNSSAEIRKNGVAWYDRTEKRYIDPDTETFVAGHVYCLGVLLMPKNGYAFSDKTTATYDGKTINFQYLEGWGEPFCDFPALSEAKNLSSIKVTKAPTKTTYTEGEKFDKTGMTVTATYSDGTTAKVTGYTYKPTAALKTTDTKITISYTEDGVTKTTTQKITVNPKPVVLSSIKVTKAPTKTTYIEGEKFDKTGMTVTATYDNGTTAKVTDYTYKPTAALKTTDTKITISYTEGGVTKTATQAITVKAKTLTGIKITTPPTKTNYTEGEKFSKTGMVVTASYDNGTTAKVTDFTFKPTTALKTTDTKITISYTENGVTKTATQAITVKAKSGTVLRGDVNGDGKVNSNDAIHLLRHTMNKDRFPITQSGDMNGDGKVDSNDAIYLLRHTMSPERYPLH